MDYFLDIFWHRKFTIYRKLIGAFFLFLTILIFFKLQNILIGTFFLFCTSYFFGSFRRRNNIVVINNKNISNARDEIQKLIDSAISNIYILTLSLNPEIYTSENVINSLLEAMNVRKVKIHVALNMEEFLNSYRNIDKHTEFINKVILNQNLFMYDIEKDLREINHFMVVDKKSFRLEELHEKENVDRKAIIIYYSNRAIELHDDFTELLSKRDISSKVKKTYIKDIFLKKNANEKE